MPQTGIEEVTAPKQSWKQNPENPAITSMKFLDANDSAGEWKMVLQTETGIDKQTRTLLHTILFPFEEMGSIASADVNADDWQDLLLGTMNGLYLYLNKGGSFQRVDLPEEVGQGEMISTATMVDVDNNGYPDILYAVFDKGVFLSYNYEGNFSTPIVLQDTDVYLPDALALGDVDHNGWLDVIIGNHSLLWEIHERSEKAKKCHVAFRKKMALLQNFWRVYQERL